MSSAAVARVRTPLIGDATLERIIDRRLLESAAEIIVAGNHVICDRLRYAGFRGRFAFYPTKRPVRADLAVAIDFFDPHDIDVRLLRNITEHLNPGSTMDATHLSIDDEPPLTTLGWYDPCRECDLATRRWDITKSAYSRRVAGREKLNHSGAFHYICLEFTRVW
ncbi:MAG TPA: hypothetical protein VNF68_09600 [Candidatus Baltobacteraceae bacterium]|nr:hypothetical protein [Candidatus Baltobacteraceae bacterium]